MDGDVEPNLAQDMKKELEETNTYYENVKLELSKIRLENVIIEEKHKKEMDENNQVQEKVEYGILIKFKGENIKIATIDEEGMLTPNRDILNNEKYSDEELEALGDMINRLGLEQGKVDINKLQEQLKEVEAIIEEEYNKKYGIKKHEKTEDIKDKEPENDKTKENKKEFEDKEKEQIAKKYNLKASQVVHIDMGTEKITDDKTFAELVRWAEGKKDIYVIPGKDPYTWKVIGREDEKEEFTEIEEANRQIYGKNPDITIKRIDGEKITEVRPIAVHDIDGDSVMAVVKDAYGQPEVLYCRKEDGEQKYWGCVVPEVSGKNVRQMEYEEREFMSSKYNSGMDLDKKAEELEKAQDLNDRGVPSKEDGVQVYEIEGNSTQNYEMTKENIEEDLYRRKGIDEKMKGAMPGYIDYMSKKIEEQAVKILKLMHDNKDMTYEQAVEITDKDGQREEGGPTPGDNRKRGN